MIFLKIIRYICGYVMFQCTGVFCEKFINMAKEQGIFFWDLSKKNVALTGFVRKSDYKKLRKIVKKTGVKLKIIKKFGLPFKIHKYRKRFGFLIGTILFIIVISIFSNMVWQINVVGNEKVSSEKIINTINELGIKKGYLGGSENYYFIEQQALINLPELSWLAINRKGSVITIDVKESYVTPKIVDLNTPCDIVANKDGLIIKINTFKGTEIIGKGSGVTKGDVIVSGKVFGKKTNETYLVHSISEIYAQTENYLTVIINKDEEYYEKTLRKSTKSTLCFFGIELPLFIDNKPFEFSDVEHNDSCIEIGTGKIGLKKDIYYEKIKKNANYTQEEMKAKAYEKMQQEISTHYPSDKVEILNTYYNEDVTENYFKLSVMLKCNEKIGEEKELNTDINVIPKTND